MSDRKIEKIEQVEQIGTKKPAELSFWQRFSRHKLAIFGMVVISILLFIVIFGPIIFALDPYKTDLYHLGQPPSGEHLMGTDLAGRDVLSRLIYGGRISLSVGLVSVGIYLFIGTILGVVSGYAGGAVDTIIQRFTEVVMTFPVIILIITIVTVVGPSIYNTMVVIGLTRWTGVCRLARGEVLKVKEMEYVKSAEAIGTRTFRILFRHVLPNITAPLIVAGTMGLAVAILLEAGLSFLGLGVPIPTPSWGNILYQARGITTLEMRPWLWLPPGILIALSVLSINFIGDALRDALDPHSRNM
jgi:peptide/nickel transport system permease protein